MKRSLLFASFLLLAACKPANRPAVVPAQFLEIAAPVHQNIELYINQYSIGSSQGMIVRPNLSRWNAKVKSKFTGETNQEGKPPYKATLEYLGRKSDGDVYAVSITFPSEAGFETITRELIYSGGDVEVWRDTQYRVGVRPSTEKQDAEQPIQGLSDQLLNNTHHDYTINQQPRAPHGEWLVTLRVVTEK